MPCTRLCKFIFRSISVIGMLVSSTKLIISWYNAKQVHQLIHLWQNRHHIIGYHSYCFIVHVNNNTVILSTSLHLTILIFPDKIRYQRTVELSSVRYYVHQIFPNFVTPASSLSTLSTIVMNSREIAERRWTFGVLSLYTNASYNTVVVYATHMFS